MVITKDNLYLTFLHPRIYREVRSNVALFREYNDKYMERNYIHSKILDVISNNDYEDISTTYLSAELTCEDKVNDKEINDVVSRIEEYKELDDSSVNQVIKSIRSVIFKAKYDEIQRNNGNSIEEIFNAIKDYDYDKVDGLGLEVTPLDFSSITDEEVEENKLVPLFKARQSALNKMFPCQSIPSGQLIQVVGAPGSGKSLMMMDMGLQASNQDVPTLYIALGDLKLYNFIIRLAALSSNRSLDECAINQISSKNHLQNHPKIAKNFKFLIYESDSITSEDLDRIIRANLDDYELIIVDYDGNLAETSDNMYNEGHIVYKNLSKFPLKHNKTVLIGSQPSKAYWKHEVLPLECANESSKKQMHIDCQITIGLYDNPYGIPCGKINVPKNRNGSKTVFNYVRSNTGAFIQVGNNTYLSFKDQILTNPQKHPSNEDILILEKYNQYLHEQGSSDIADIETARAWYDMLKSVPDKKPADEDPNGNSDT